MSIIICADLHFGADRLHTIGKAWMELHDYADAHQIPTVVVAGDFHDDGRLAMGHDATAGDIQHATLAPRERYPYIHWLIVKGNHDEDGGPGHRSALEYLRAVPHTRVVETPQILEDRNFCLALIPWAWNSYLLADPEMRALPRDEFQRRAAILRERVIDGLAAQWQYASGMQRLMIGHGEVGGAVNRYRPLPPGQFHVFDIETLRRSGADHQLWGHYHKRQAIGGIDVFVGALVQHDAGEQDNPTGFCVVHDNGQREWVSVDCPRFYTVRSMEELERLEVRPQDDVKLQASQRPRDLPEGVRFDKVLAPADNRVRTDGITVDSGPTELLAEWWRVNPAAQQVGLAELQEALADLLARCPLPPVEALQGGRLDCVRQIVLRGIGTHRDTVIDIPPSLDGPIAFYGEVGSGKSTALEATYACWFGEFPTYKGPFYDMIQPGYNGIPTIEVLFGSQGRMFRAIRRFHVSDSGKSRSTESVLNEVVEVGGQPKELPLTTSKRGDFGDAIRTHLGDGPTLRATVFQSQGDVGNIVDAEPPERMEMMRGWVGADRFAPLHEQAKAAAKQLADDMLRSETRLAPLRDVEERLDAATAHLEEMRAAALALEQKVAERTEAGQQLAAQKATLEVRQQEAAQQVERKRSLERTARDRQREAERLHDQIAAIHKEAGTADEVAQAITLLGEAEQRLEALEAAHQQWVAAEEHRQRIVSATLRVQHLERQQEQRRDRAQQAREAEVRNITGAIGQIESDLRHKLLGAEGRLADLKVRGGLLEQAGCRENPIVGCAFIKDALAAVPAQAALQEEIDGLRATLEFRSFGYDDSDRLLRLEQTPLQVERVEGLQAERDALQALESIQYPSLPSRADEVRQAKQLVERLRPARERQASFAATERHLESLRTQMEQMVRQVDEANEAAAALQPPDPSAIEAELRSAEQTLNGLREEVRRLHQEARQLQTQEGAATQTLERLLKDAEERDRLLADLEGLKPLLGVANGLAAFLHPTGAPQLIIDLMTPRLNEIVAQILAEVGDEDFCVTFRTQREQKNTRMLEGFFIDVTDAFGTRDITRHSGGECSRLRRAVRLTLGWWQVERHGHHHKVYFLDEPTLGMSPMWTQRFMAAIFRLSERFNQVWIVSHDPTVLQACPAAFRFVRPPKQTTEVWFETGRKPSVQRISLADKN